MLLITSLAVSKQVQTLHPSQYGGGQHGAGPDIDSGLSTFSSLWFRVIIELRA